MRGWLKSKTINQFQSYDKTELPLATFTLCLLYTSDAADE